MFLAISYRYLSKINFGDAKIHQKQYVHYKAIEYGSKSIIKSFDVDLIDNSDILIK